MSRDIKFRVKVTWCDSVWLASVDYMKSDGFGGWYGLAFININSWESAQVEFHTDADDVLMQYTGLKDKNGVEIYEGDILWLGDAGSIVQILWSDFKLRLKWVNPMGASDNIYAWKDDLEVIGNIYENPELLEASNEN